ncbi:MAG: c-type cytochrome [Opitutaceae bacterium]|nr:c-type cytochrome [Opitutaceae bacterium]
MKNLLKTSLAAAVLFIIASGTHAQENNRTELLARGRYLVQGVGLCIDCHSPRDEKGQFIPGQVLKGAPIGFVPAAPMPAWGAVAPALAGLPTMTEAQAVQFLQHGLKPDGSRPRPPMPEYRLNEADATAVAAYLKSLGQ